LDSTRIIIILKKHNPVLKISLSLIA